MVDRILYLIDAALATESEKEFLLIVDLIQSIDDNSKHGPFLDDLSMAANEAAARNTLHQLRETIVKEGGQ